MARNMNIAADCAECCTCPAPTIQWDSRSVMKSKCGWAEFSSPSTPPKIYRSATLAGFTWAWNLDADDGSEVINETFTVGLDCAAGVCAVGAVISLSGALAGSTYWWAISPGQTELPTEDVILPDATCGTDYVQNFNLASASPVSSTATVATYNYGFGPATLTLSVEYLTSELITQAISELPAFPGTWDGTAGSFRNVSADELSVAIGDSRYRCIFPVPLVGSGACYRVDWVERFIAETGVAIDSAEIVTRGVYRPTVSWSGGGGSGLLLVAVMASDGTVSAIRILNPGIGFTSAPTITVQSATGGGTTSTGWAATVAGGRVATITGGTPGDYLPTGALSGGGGSGATIAFTLDETGGLATCPLGSGGSAYVAEPTLTITPKVSGSLAARVDLHLGTETARCAAWDGVVPPGYDPEDDSTWPILGDGISPYFELPIPAADGEALVANVRAYCDCSACP